ncbi:flagellar basal body P-ring formation chaperone FlgA [Pantoea sp. 18069]|uniref:flagellar basal body P-ring formation chaperone FlgA n=1 Tax=Pantoea sp. 18069 TaxID=2681415 RepID=UPI00190F119B|nr:flagellar basal body P-ring formation chaperone FlgA [Pantoea sp. 18069]
MKRSPWPLAAPVPAATRLRGLAGAVLAGLGLWLGGAQAQTHAELEALSQQWANAALGSDAGAGLPLRLQVQIGKLDARLQLAACAKVEPYLPAGSRLWGRTRLGLRCLQGPRAWNVFVPVTVQAFGPAWVLNNNVRQGDALTAGDASVAEVDWAEVDSPVVANQPDWLGLEAARHLQAGQALRQNMLRPPQLFALGAQVKVSVSGGGFAIISSGRAMAAGAEGANVRVRMDNGRLVSGVVNAQGVVEVN